MKINERERQILDYALCFLAANFDEDGMSDLIVEDKDLTEEIQAVALQIQTNVKDNISLIHLLHFLRDMCPGMLSALAEKIDVNEDALKEDMKAFGVPDEDYNTGLMS